MAYRHKLAAHAKQIGHDSRIAIVGAGQMGRGFANQVHRMPGLAVSLIVDTNADRIINIYKDLKITDYVISDNAKELVEAIKSNKPAGTTQSALLNELADIELVVECTGIPNTGAQITYEALQAKKDVAVLNVEMEVTVGPILNKIATENHLIYGVCHGDEPTECKELVDFALDLNFEVICAGKGKNNPFEPFSNPDSVRERALAKHMNPKMLCSFTDGTKTMTEMVALANATGLQLSKRGMYGPASSVKTLAQTYALQADGGILDRPGVVDYCTGDVAPGVFVIVKTDSPYVVEELEYLMLGKGPYFALYRPYHLASVEAPLTIAKAIIDRESTLFSEKLNAEVVCMTKKDLNPGDKIDGIGGYTVRGYADIAADAKRDGLLPIGLAAGATITKAIKAGELLTYDHVELEDSFILKLRKQQDALGLS
ncbi:MAG: NAD(P)H-dependent oxidoreductase [Candidatus Nanopelagicaceae bacterium]